MEENKKPQVALTDQERFPLLGDLTLLNQLRQDESAPNFNFQSGDRLQEKHLAALDEYKKHFEKREPINEQPPNWVGHYIKECIQNVPHYKGRTTNFLEHPTVTKQEIRETPWNFMGDHANLDELLVYQTSGTTGPPMDVSFSPVTQASWLVQLESILLGQGIALNRKPNEVAIALICDQVSTITYASLSTYLNGAGVLKLNLHENEWKKREDRVAYLEKYNPEILTGDPFSFLSLKALNPKISPKALVSSAMKLQEPVRKELEAYFNCPVIDTYSMTECRMIAYKEGEGFRSIRPDLYFEVFASGSDTLLPEGQRGELVITGGNNPFMHLIRYRTGDYCRLEVKEGIQYIMDLEAREPVAFYKKDNQLVNNIDISRAMAEFPLAGFELRQKSDYSIEFMGWANSKLEDEITRQLLLLFGSGLKIKSEVFPTKHMKSDNKRTVYVSELNG